MNSKQEKMEQQQNKQMDPYSLNPEPSYVSQQKIALLAQLAKKYYGLENKFKGESFFSRKEYYVLSSKWLQRWKLYVGYTQINSAVPPNKFLGCGTLPTANQDIVQSFKSPTLEFQDSSYHLNISLKPNLCEGKDYVFITKEMHYCLKDCQDYEMIRIPRQVVSSSQGKIVQMYYQKINLIVLFNSLCKDIEQQRLNKFNEAKFQYSRYSTIEQFNTQITRYIKKFMEEQPMADLSNDNMKSWLLNEGIQKNIFFNTLKEGFKANNTFDYKIFVNAQLMENQKQIKDYDITPNSFVVAELRQLSKSWMFFNKTHIYQGTCNYCKSKQLLKVLCSCKFAAYCSQPCKIRDKSSHRNRCPNQAQSDVQDQILTLSSSSKKGRVGLRNLGNTCFMNSGLQCISHVQQVLQYFTENKYIAEINKVNKLGTQGQLSTSFAKMLQNLWFGSDSSFSPTKLKRSIAKFQPIFEGYNQHDAGQLINYVLDGLHEDLNRIKDKPYVQQKDYDGRPDKIIAKESWQNFKMRNNSIITDLMYGQYKSKVDCPNCKFSSIQFDPFLMFSLPLINSSKKQFSIIFIKDHIQQIPLSITYSVNAKQKFSSLFQAVREKMNLQKNSPLVCFKTTYSQIKLISADEEIEDHEKQYYSPKIFIRELLKGQNPEQDYQIALTNVVKSSYHYNKKISSQKLYFFSKEDTYKKVYFKLYSYYKKLYEVASLQQEVILENDKERPFKFLCKPQYRYRPCIYCGQRDCQGCMLKFSDQKFMKDVQTPSQIEMQIFWIKNAQQIKQRMQKLQADDDKQKDDKKDVLSLEDCFRLSAQPQTLTEDNAWYCPKCKDFVLAQKQMLIYKAPKILILCLKRFKRKQYHSEKLSTFVNYPLENLDMSQYMLDTQLPNSSNQLKSHDGKVIYDLISVCNHMGSTGGGHYTAYCRDLQSGDWFQFDDSSVSSVHDPEKQVISKAGYVLFYRRRQ